MEFRVLHGLAYGEHWFGRWGYRFARGTFGVSKQMYQKATEAIQTIPLCIFLHHLGTFRNEITFIVSRYQTLSECSLVTLGDLFHFMMELKSRLPKENSRDGIPVENTCRWSLKRVELATQVIVEALRKSKFKWVSRQEVRDAARAYIGDTGLLDFVLKSLGNHIVGKYLVRRSLNPVTKVLEYCLEDISNSFPKQEVLVTNDSRKARYQNITRIQIMKDIYYLYKHILKEQKGSFPSIPLATRIILDSKYLVKDYFGDYSPLKFESGPEKNINLYCTVMLDKAKPPYELVVLKDNVSIDELKLEVEKVFRGLYWGLRDLVVTSIVNLNSKGEDLVSAVVEAGSKIVFEGSGIKNEDIYESGENNHIVDCNCGTKDDDGERMISCDICEVWQHTRCVQIPNNEEIPHIFICDRCERDILFFPSLP